MISVGVIKTDNHAKSSKLPDKEQRAQYCNQENQQTVGLVHFSHNPEKNIIIISEKKLPATWAAHSSCVHDSC